MYNTIKLEQDYERKMMSVYKDMLVTHIDDNANVTINGGNSSSNQKRKQEIEENMSVKLSKEQKKAIDLFKKGNNILVLGAGGTGKSEIIREIQYYIETNEPGKNVAVTGTTGIASYNINGITLTSFMGIGTGEDHYDVMTKRIMKKRDTRERIQKLDVLIVDEISMASAELFEKINEICQAVRKNKRFFGGIQLVLAGDFLQLLPVFKDGNPKSKDKRLLIESEIFNKHFTKKNIINLKKNFRQENAEYSNLLLRLRKGEHTEKDLKKIKSRMTNETKDMVHLVTSNRKAHTINMKQMEQLKSNETYTYTLKEETKSNVELFNEIQKQFEQRGIDTVTLKEGARVMLIKNLSVEDGLVNGMGGTIISFENEMEVKFPIVKFDNNKIQTIRPVVWEYHSQETTIRVSQIPLMLSWAITIHKSQSITLDSAVMDLADCFCEHQIYAALSRVRRLENIYIKSFDEQKIKVNETVKEYLSKL
jgi:ATP-dependent DNA helicase PIF1